MKLFEEDLKSTILNRERISKNKNLLYWYQISYKKLFNDIKSFNGLRVLEIGSGTSPIKIFYPHINTSDILPLDFVDYHFNALDINTCKQLEGQTFDIITFSNVLHHLERPIDFLTACQKKLNSGGKIIFLEPYLSFFSFPIYKYIHYEKTITNVDEPLIKHIDGPLSTSNQALPYLIFFRNKSWQNLIKQHYKIEYLTYFTFLSYFLTGGISHNYRIPHILYKIIFKIDLFISKLFPRLFSSFFIIKLCKK